MERLALTVLICNCKAKLSGVAFIVGVTISIMCSQKRYHRWDYKWQLARHMEKSEERRAQTGQEERGPAEVGKGLRHEMESEGRLVPKAELAAPKQTNTIPQKLP